IKPKKLYSKDVLFSIFKEIKSDKYGNIIRVKGFLPLDEKDSLKIDYVLGQTYITETNLKSENILIIIGKELKTNKLKEIFE
ncbi:MAG: GTP-binding protein, partial [Promethearchaeota archaeon]